MYYAMRASAPSLHRESTDSLIYINSFQYLQHPIDCICQYYSSLSFPFLIIIIYIFLYFLLLHYYIIIKKKIKKK